VTDSHEISFRNTGVLGKEDIQSVYPSEERLKQGPVAVIECVECIPCDPCVRACPQGAITMDGGLCCLPQLNEHVCTGCRLCVPCCPGLAIFVVDESLAGEKARITIPYEFLPRPDAGAQVDLLDRCGEVCGRGVVERVVDKTRFDRTALVTLLVPRELARVARHFNRVK